MQRLIAHFKGAAVCRPEDRQFGLEVENLLVDDAGEPIMPGLSQRIMTALRDRSGWRESERRHGMLTAVEKPYDRAGWRIFYELGAGNFELVTPLCATREARFFSPERMMSELSRSAEVCGARMLDVHYDGYAKVDNLIVPDERDAVWVELDGRPALCQLAHIASLHVNIDLTSPEEGVEFMAALERLAAAEGWPLADSKKCWAGYIDNGLAAYEPTRFGPPPISSFEGYCEALAGYKVVMQSVPSGTEIVRKPKPFAETAVANIELFLRSVWWWQRLRVRNGRLVLEVRFLPRSSPESMRMNTVKVLSALGVT